MSEGKSQEEKTGKDSTSKTTNAKNSGGGKGKVLKIVAAVIAGILALCLVAGVAGYFIFLRPASAEAVCENFFELSREEINEALDEDYSEEEIYDQLGITLEECIEEEEEYREDPAAAGGLLEITRISRCQADAESLDELENCEDE
jgi:proteasome assembly chaperone (PAC2) family protein